MRLIEAEPVRYGMQKILINDLQQCIYSFERMKKGGIGIADEFVYQTCKRALEYIGKLEAEPVRHGEWLNSGINGTVSCSLCMFTDFFAKQNRVMLFKYCPGCGAKMDGGDNST